MHSSHGLGLSRDRVLFAAFRRNCIKFLSIWWPGADCCDSASRRNVACMQLRSCCNFGFIPDAQNVCVCLQHTVLSWPRGITERPVLAWAPTRIYMASVFWQVAGAPACFCFAYQLATKHADTIAGWTESAPGSHMIGTALGTFHQ